jgi:hypothetical protein
MVGMGILLFVEINVDQVGEIIFASRMSRLRRV